MLHFGAPPRFSPGVRFIQMEESCEDLHQNIASALCLTGSLRGNLRKVEAAFESVERETPQV
jgi:hypothetical protein